MVCGSLLLADDPHLGSCGLACAYAGLRPSKPRYGAGVMLRPLDLVEPVICHASFRVRLCDGKRAIGAAPAAAKRFRAVVGVADLGEVQAGIAPADIAAHERGPKVWRNAPKL